VTLSSSVEFDGNRLPFSRAKAGKKKGRLPVLAGLLNHGDYFIRTAYRLIVYFEDEISRP
jgi:hypothetical protein